MVILAVNQTKWACQKNSKKGGVIFVISVLASHAEPRALHLKNTKNPLAGVSSYKEETDKQLLVKLF